MVNCLRGGRVADPYKTSVKSGAAELIPDAAEPPVPDENGNAVPVTFRFKVGGVKTAVVVGSGEPPAFKLHLLVEDEDGNPHKSRPFEVKAGGKSFTGTTTAEGIVEVSFPKAPEALLTVDGAAGKQHYQLQLGKIEKPDTPLGAQQRLQSLGFELRATGKLDDDTKKAIAAFRKEVSLKDGSDLDAETQQKLDDEYKKRMAGG